MPYVLPMERWAREEGRREGRVLTTREFVARILARRFAVDADEWVGRLAGIEDLERLEQLETAAWTTPSLQEFQHTGPWNGAGRAGTLEH